jgi:hypothetical protein
MPNISVWFSFCLSGHKDETRSKYDSYVYIVDITEYLRQVKSCGHVHGFSIFIPSMSTGGVEELVACSSVLSSRGASASHVSTLLELGSSLPIPETFSSGDLGLVVAYVLMFPEEVKGFLKNWKWQKILEEGSLKVEQQQVVRKEAMEKGPTRGMEVEVLMSGINSVKREVEMVRQRLDGVKEVEGSPSKSGKRDKSKEGKGKSVERYSQLPTTGTTTTKSTTVTSTTKADKEVKMVRGTEEGVEFVEIEKVKLYHPSSITWKDGRNSHEYETDWDILKSADVEIARKLKTRMVTLIMSNQFGWKVAKSVCGLEEMKIGVKGEGIEELVKEAEKLQEKVEKEKDRDEKKGDKGQGRPNGSGFQGSCYLCGKFGHSARFCKGGSFGGGSFGGGNSWTQKQCYNCGQMGHGARFCQNGGRSLGGMGQGMYQQQQNQFQQQKGWGQQHQFQQQQQQQLQNHGQTQGNGTQRP